MKTLLLGKTNSHLMVQHREGTVKRQVVTQKPLWFLPCHSCCELQLQLAVETVKSNNSLASHFCTNTCSTTLASQMYFCLHTSPANAMAFAQDQPWRVESNDVPLPLQGNETSGEHALNTSAPSSVTKLLLTMCSSPEKQTIRTSHIAK